MNCKHSATEDAPDHDPTQSQADQVAKAVGGVVTRRTCTAALLCNPVTGCLPVHSSIPVHSWRMQHVMVHVGPRSVARHRDCVLWMHEDVLGSKLDSIKAQPLGYIGAL